MNLKELKEGIRDIGGTALDNLSKWMEKQTHPAFCDKASVELAADRRHVLVWYYLSRGFASYELSSHELYLLEQIVGVPVGDCIATPNGTRNVA